MKFAIASIRLSIGQFSHILAFKEMMEARQHEVVLLLHSDYEEICLQDETLKDFKNICYINSVADVKNIKVDVVLFYNTSLLDRLVITRLRKNNRLLIVVYTYHEPWRGIASWLNDYRKGRVKFIAVVKSTVMHMIASTVLSIANIILLPSEKAEEIYLCNDVQKNSNYFVFPLIYRDEAPNVLQVKERQYFSFIATADKEKNFPLYLKCISLFLKYDETFFAQIITKTDISSYWIHELDSYVESGRLRVVSGRMLSNEEINAALAQSYCTWLFYHHSTQSGVLARAFMMSSPVIASNRGCFERYIDGENGIIISEDQSEDAIIREIWQAQKFIKEKQLEMTGKARDTFEKEFFYKKYEEYFEMTLKSESEKFK